MNQVAWTTPPTELQTLARALAEVGRTLHARGWLPATSGNLSARLADGSMAITASGADKGSLRGPPSGDVLHSSPGGEVLSPVGGRTSAETLLHVQIYRHTPGARAVLHVHSPAATVLSRIAGPAVSLEGYELLKALAGISTHDHVARVPVVPNRQDMRELCGLVQPLFDRGEAPHGYLIEGHGMYAWGRDLAEARRHVEALEFLFECELRHRSLR
jgi:methylthioribulose-1-phosphate dehydratase